MRQKQENIDANSQERSCGGLNENGCNRPVGSGFICIVMAYLKEMCHWGWTLRYQVLMPSLVALSLASAYEFVITAPCRFVCSCASYCDDNSLNL